MVIGRADGAGRVALRVGGGTRAAGSRRAEHGGAGNGGKPGAERDLALHLAALAEARDDGSDEQASWVGMHMRIQAEAGGDDAGSDVRAVLDMEVAIGTEFPALLRAARSRWAMPCGAKG